MQIKNHSRIAVQCVCIRMLKHMACLVKPSLLSTQDFNYLQVFSFCSIFCKYVTPQFCRKKEPQNMPCPVKPSLFLFSCFCCCCWLVFLFCFCTKTSTVFRCSAFVTYQYVVNVLQQNKRRRLGIQRSGTKDAKCA